MNQQRTEARGGTGWSVWSEFQSQAPWLGAAMVPILALAILGPQVLDPVLVLGAALVLGTSTGSMLTTLLLAVAAVAAWKSPVVF